VPGVSVVFDRGDNDCILVYFGCEDYWELVVSVITTVILLPTSAVSDIKNKRMDIR
jgi:hypothetical protein